MSKPKENYLQYSLLRLISQLEDRVKVVSEEISSLEGVDKKADELQEKIVKLNRALAAIKVWHQDHSETEDKLMVSHFQAQ